MKGDLIKKKLHDLVWYFKEGLQDLKENMKIN